MEFLNALKMAEKVLQDSFNFILGHAKTASAQDYAIHLISEIKSILTLLNQYNVIDIQGFKPQDSSAFKEALEKLQTKLEAL